MNKKNFFSAVVILAIIGSIVYLESQKPSLPPASEARPLAVRDMGKKDMLYPRAKEITAPSGFINTPEGTTVAQFIGKKVILVDFWTYSCINCQRTLPYIKAWDDKYRDKGLQILSIHTPEFDFEKVIGNVKAAVEKFGIKYPVIMDNDYGTWGAYQNQYWPRKYLIDIDGYIVYDHIGEGGYEETEKKIQELLDERMIALGEKGAVEKTLVKPAGVEVASEAALSPETYFGAARNVTLGNGDQGAAGPQMFKLPATLQADRLYLSGDWQMENEYAVAMKAGDKITFKYHAQKVFLVAGSEKPAKISVSQDGRPVSILTIQPHQLYRLIEGSEYVGARDGLLEITVQDPGIQCFTFTFG